MLEYEVEQMLLYNCVHYHVSYSYASRVNPTTTAVIPLCQTRVMSRARLPRGANSILVIYRSA